MQVILAGNNSCRATPNTETSRHNSRSCQGRHEHNNHHVRSCERLATAHYCRAQGKSGEHMLMLALGMALNTVRRGLLISSFNGGRAATESQPFPKATSP
jgi:hypothetical protein